MNESFLVMQARLRVDHYCRQLAVALLLLVLAGCATTRIDWNSRIGSYTFDQAVTELGPPDKSARLSDGSFVAEWLQYRGYSGGAYYPSFYPWYGYGFYYVDPPSPDRFLRLMFGPDDKLKTWKRVYK